MRPRRHLRFSPLGKSGSSLKKLCLGHDLPAAAACDRFDRLTGDGVEMSTAQKALATAVASIIGKKEERAVASLFSPGGTYAKKESSRGSKTSR